MKAADITKLKMLHNQGVKELEIKATLYKATADYERRKAHAVGTLGAIGKHIKQLAKKPNDVTPDGLRVTLTLKAHKLFSKAFRIGEKQIEAMAADVVKNSEKNDEFVIVTKTGQKISQSEIFVRCKAQIDSVGKTVDRDKAWKECAAFYKSLKDGGIVEQ
jgi:hypothetical protein